MKTVAQSSQGDAVSGGSSKKYTDKGPEKNALTHGLSRAALATWFRLEWRSWKREEETDCFVSPGEFWNPAFVVVIKFHI